MVDPRLAERRRISRFTFGQNQRSGRSYFPNVRDTVAYTELLVALMAQGYTHHDTIFNHAPRGEDPSRTLADSIGPEDLIVVSTRPPIEEQDEKRKTQPRKTIPRSESWIESRILDGVSDFITTSRRDHIALGDLVQNAVGEKYETDADAEVKTEVDVYTKARAVYKNLPDDMRSRDGNKSPVYLLRIPHIRWGGRLGPGLLAVFGMSGALSLAWAYILRTRHPELLEGSRFLMGELTLPRQFPPNPVNPAAFCGDWNFDIVFDLALPIQSSRALGQEDEAPGLSELGSQTAPMAPFTPTESVVSLSPGRRKQPGVGKPGRKPVGYAAKGAG